MLADENRKICREKANRENFSQSLKISSEIGECIIAKGGMDAPDVHASGRDIRSIDQ